MGSDLFIEIIVGLLTTVFADGSTLDHDCGGVTGSESWHCRLVVGVQGTSLCGGVEHGELTLVSARLTTRLATRWTYRGHN